MEEIRRKRINDELKRIARELDISDEKYKRATNSYEAVGTYINNHIPENDVKIFSQGSFKLGTVIKPISDKEDYDIDLVCLIEKQYHNPEELKNVIGKVLKESNRYSGMLEREEDGSIKEGKRCWTIIYSDEAQYHMDILPAIKDITYNKDKQLKITNKDEVTNKYSFTSTNPEEYYEWFQNKMKVEKRKLLLEYAQDKNIDIEKVPEYKVKTTLQIAIQIIKRYRDIKFEKNPDNKPISIILTTIMANLYEGEDDIYELIKKFSKNFYKCLEKDIDGNFVIKNPVNEKENFADKWILYPERKVAFFNFMRELENDLVGNRVLNEGLVTEMGEEYKRLFGKNIVEKMYKNLGEETRRKREDNKLYINKNGNINKENGEKKVKEHKFYGE